MFAIHERSCNIRRTYTHTAHANPTISNIQCSIHTIHTPSPDPLPAPESSKEATHNHYAAAISPHIRTWSLALSLQLEPLDPLPRLFNPLIDLIRIRAVPDGGRRTGLAACLAADDRCDGRCPLGSVGALGLEGLYPSLAHATPKPKCRLELTSET
jgi:hypothetical protein